MITLDRLREVLEYNPESGLWVWVKRTGKKSAPGKIAGSVHKHGYIVIRIDRVIYKAHRLAWFYMTGAWPKAHIDHINNVPGDNRWANLREATAAQNNANRGARSSSKSGIRGVTWDEDCKRWRAQITVNGKCQYIGLFDTADEARVAYQQRAQLAYGDFAWKQ